MSGALLLAQFLLRTSFGLALGMALTSPRQVTGGYYRNHLYVLLGLDVLAALACYSAPGGAPIWPALAAAVASYLGAVCWLYAKAGPGILALAATSGLSLAGAWLIGPSSERPAIEVLEWLDPPTSGLVLGLTLAAMFLGHWYLNTPSMALQPLERLIWLMGAAIVVRAIVAAAGLAVTMHESGWHSTEQTIFLVLRWSSGLAGALLLTVMAQKTLRIPNTQSATGILYVAVIATFLGELTSLLMSSEIGSPV